MVREFLIKLYLLLFKIQFNFFKLFPLQDKIVFVVSFKDNSLFVYEEMKRRKIRQKVVFLCESSSFNVIKNNVDAQVLLFESKNIIDMVKAIYYLAISKNIIVDNYFGFLSAVSFKDGVQCTQLWHAAGAIKTFGLKDKSVSLRTKRAKERFQRVYNQFDKVIVGSDEMAEIFKKAFNLSENNILYTGIPRTDIFYNQEHQEMKRRELFRQNPQLKDKKIIFYVPTFRDDSLDSFDFQLDLDQMCRELSGNYVVLIKLHPAIKNRPIIEKRLEGFVFDYSTYANVNDLLFLTDYLITDYSSIPYEFSLLEKPMIFYPYDLVEYQEQRGFWGRYEDLVPGPVVYETKDIIEVIKNNQFDYEKIRDFSRTWNKYSLGRSSENLVNSLFENNMFLNSTEKNA
ncbi:CDP-glycerol glycerophosphotransferase family protein [Heyndrickxia sp. NPDC080065]|uniref:CDP-glycerol glycerophosphotransferase family protein n=1 Tax=Heyndrickxia sp. NPDC080065 TaxID=3390568 RepID=UPI003D060DC6